MPRTSSAVPADLRRYADVAGDLAGRMRGDAGSLGHALDRFRGSGADLMPVTGPLDQQLRHVAGRTAALATRTGQVGQAFGDAGGAGQLVTLPDVLIARYVVRYLESATAATVPEVLEELRGLEAELDDPHDRIDAVRALFDGLPPELQELLADSAPEVVGPLDGAPVELRYRANLLLIERERDATRAAIARGDGDLDVLTARLETLELLLEERVDPITGEVGARQFLLFDPEGPGRAAEVFGDLDEAGHVTTSVPGMTSKLDGYFEGFSQDVRHLAEQLRREDHARGGDGRVAAIAWQGYQAPQAGGVLLPRLAREGARLLDEFDHGLPPTDAQRTWIGHSYGSRVVGEALRLDVRYPERVVFIGSPGVGAAQVDELGLPDGTQVYAARGPLDAVTYPNVPHGFDPTDPRFGATRLDTSPITTDDPVVWWHSSYYSPGSWSLRNMALLALGEDEHVRVVEPSRADRLVATMDDLQAAVSQTRARLDYGLRAVEHASRLPPDVRAAVRVARGLGSTTETVVNRTIAVHQTVLDQATDITEDVRDLTEQLAPRIREWAEGQFRSGVEWAGDRVRDVGDVVGDIDELLTPRPWPWR